MISLRNLLIASIFGIVLTVKIESNFRSEDTCSSIKGYCVLENECPGPADHVFKELCPNQKGAGAVCCKNFPHEDVNCYQTHNECFKNCPSKLNLGQKGCPEGDVCCVLV